MLGLVFGGYFYAQKRKRRITPPLKERSKNEKKLFV